MKHLSIIQLIFCSVIILASCATAKQAKTTRRIITNPYEQATVFLKQYPWLEQHVDEGLVYVSKAVEITHPDGRVDYKISYGFLRKDYTDYSERMSVLKENFPEIYRLYTNGAVIVDELYKYVDKNMKIQVHIGYRYVTSPTYNYYRGY